MRPNSVPSSRRRGRSIWTARCLGLAATLTLVIGGCAEEGPAGRHNSSPSATPAERGTPPAGTPAQVDDKTKAPARAPAAPRKIIYDARVDLLVESLNATEQAILNLIKLHDGFLAESDQSSVTRTQRSATWRVRVPVDHFDAFLAAVNHLGEVRQNHVGSQDVTEEFFDLEARIRNKQEEEKRLLKHLADSTGKLEDILAVERELSRVRGEVEQMQGRLRFLANRADLSTVTIEATEWQDFKPPAPATLQAQIGRTFSRSVESLVDFSKALLLVAVAIAPWLPLVVLVILLARWIARFRRGPARSQPLRPTPTQPKPV
jgi:hypothetical protein